VVRIIGLWSKATGKGANIEAFEPDVLLEDGRDLSDYGLDARVVLLPGHSRGSIGILTGSGDLFGGDLLANFRRPGLHVYIDDLGQADESLRRVRDLDVETVCPGHGRPFRVAQLPG
jgi:hydroxyacylglutathione hydrolase